MKTRSVITSSRCSLSKCKKLEVQINHVSPKADALRCASTEAMVKPRRRLKFDPTEPLTFRESLRIEQKREQRKKMEREAVSNYGDITNFGHLQM